MDQGWAFYEWSTENDGWLSLSGVRRASPGYLKQEVDKLMAEAKQHYGIK